MTLKDLKIEKSGVLVIFFAILGCDAHLNSNFLQNNSGARPRQLAYEIKLVLSRVS